MREFGRGLEAIPLLLLIWLTGGNSTGMPGSFGQLADSRRRQPIEIGTNIFCRAA